MFIRRAFQLCFALVCVDELRLGFSAVDALAIAAGILDTDNGILETDNDAGVLLAPRPTLTVAQSAVLAARNSEQETLAAFADAGLSAVSHSVAMAILAVMSALGVLGCLIALLCSRLRLHFLGDLEDDSVRTMITDSEVEEQRFKRRCVQVFFVLCNVVHLARCTVVIPQSHALAVDLGQGAAFSGLVIGCSYALTLAGTAVSRRYFMQPWDQRRNRHVIMAAYFALSLADVVSACAADPPLGWRMSPAQRLTMLLFGRGLIGMLLGQSLLLMRVMAFKITPVSEVVSLGMCRTFAMAAGTGLGPLLPYAVFRVLGSMGDVALLSRTLLLVSAVGLALPLCCTHIFPLNLSLLELAKRREEAKDVSLATASAKPQVAVEACRAVVVFNAVSFALLWGLMISSLEAASAMILEIEFGFATPTVGLFVALTFLAGLPVMLVLVVVCRVLKFGDAQVCVVVLAAALCASFFLQEQVSAVLSGSRSLSWVPVLIADALIFSTTYMASGIVDGFANACTIPGTWYSQENYIFFHQLCTTSVRCVGPVVARSLLHISGRNSYMTLQFGLTLGLISLAHRIRSALVEISARDDATESEAKPDNLDDTPPHETRPTEATSAAQAKLLLGESANKMNAALFTARPVEE